MTGGRQAHVAAAQAGRPSLVDAAEDALRSWLAAGQHRTGDRLPSEQELSVRLGVSRGTLRTAVERLADSGELVRRQGSGTFVGEDHSTSLDEGLEKLVSYTVLAERRGVRLKLSELEIERRPVGVELGEVFELPAETLATTITRVLLLDGQPAAHMRDVVRPGLDLPPPARLRRELEGGQMVLDVLLAHELPVAYARTQIRPRLLTSRDKLGAALGLRRTSAALEIGHVICSGEQLPLQHSTDVFLPHTLDLHVMRWLGDPPPVRSIAGEGGGGASALLNK
jgi:GntR family transcriptional regulator